MEYRTRIKKVQADYIHARQRSIKTEIISDIIRQVRAEGGRFLKQDEKDKLWYEVDDKEVKKKTSQTLREGAPQWRKTQGEWKRRADVEGSGEGGFPAGQSGMPLGVMMPPPNGSQAFYQPPTKKAKTEAPSTQQGGLSTGLDLLSNVAHTMRLESSDKH